MIIDEVLRNEISELIIELRYYTRGEEDEITQDSLGELLIQIKHVESELFKLFRQNVKNRNKT